MAQHRTKATRHNGWLKAREDKGWIIDDVLFEQRDTVPEPWRMSRAGFSRLENAATPEGTLDPVKLWWLARTYGRSLEELSPRAAAAVEKVFELQNEGSTRSSWNGLSAGQELCGAAA